MLCVWCEAFVWWITLVGVSSRLFMVQMVQNSSIRGKALFQETTAVTKKESRREVVQKVNQCYGFCR